MAQPPEQRPLYFLDHYRKIKESLLGLSATVVQATSEFRSDIEDHRRLGETRLSVRQKVAQIHEDVLQTTDVFPHTADKLRSEFYEELNMQISELNTYPENMKKFQVSAASPLFREPSAKPSRGVSP